MNDKPIVKIKLLPGGKMPEKKTAGAAAWDCFAREDEVIDSKPMIIGLGFCIELPPGYVAYIIPRSSTGYKTGLRCPNSIGVIDSDYRGEVAAIYENKFEGKVYNGCLIPYSNHEIKAGERICQMIIDKLPDVDLVQVDELSETDRGTSGFGSTGTR